MEHLGKQPARDFLRKLGDQKPYFYTQPEVGRNGLLAGEWDLNMQGMSGALFLDFFLSPEGQKLVAEVQGSITQEELDKREKDGVKLPARITFQSLDEVDKVPVWMKMFEELVMRK